MTLSPQLYCAHQIFVKGALRWSPRRHWPLEQDDVVFRSPVLWRPKEGKATAMLYLSSAVRVLEDFTYHRQFVGDNTVVLEFSSRIGQLSVKGVDIIQFNAEGQIVDFEVMVRPVNGLQALAVGDDTPVGIC